MAATLLRGSNNEFIHAQSKGILAVTPVTLAINGATGTGTQLIAAPESAVALVCLYNDGVADALIGDDQVNSNSYSFVLEAGTKEIMDVGPTALETYYGMSVDATQPVIMVTEIG